MLRAAFYRGAENIYQCLYWFLLYNASHQRPNARVVGHLIRLYALVERILFAFITWK